MGGPGPESLLIAVAALGIAAGCGSSDDDPSRPPAIELGSDGVVSVAATGDFGMQETSVATLEAMAEAEPDVYLGLGDFSYAGPESVEPFCELIATELGPDAPFAIVSGNHEEDPGADGRLADFADCLPDRVGAVGDYGREYYFDVGRLARIIMISPALTIDGERYRYRREGVSPDRHLAWLEATIDEARRRGVKWLVVGMHMNCLSVGRYGCKISKELVSTLLDRGVDIVLSGHDHTYQRSHQLAAPRPGCPRVTPNEFDRDCVADSSGPYRKGGGTLFLVSGAGGAFGSFYSVYPNDPEAGYFAASMGENTRGKRHGFSLLTLEPGRASIRFVGSTPGRFGDRALIAAGPG